MIRPVSDYSYQGDASRNRERTHIWGPLASLHAMRTSVAVTVFSLWSIPLVFLAVQRTSPFQKADVGLPKGNGTWAARVVRTGGFNGDSLDVEVRSNGELKCEPIECPKRLEDEKLQSLTPSFDLATIEEARSSVSVACRDCVLTAITLKMRDGKGKVREYHAFWDERSKGRVHPEIVRLANRIASLR